MIRASEARELSKGGSIGFDIDEKFAELVEYSIRSASQDGYYHCTVEADAIYNEYDTLPREQIDTMVTLLEGNDFDVQIEYDSDYDVESIVIDWSEYV